MKKISMFAALAIVLVAMLAGCGEKEKLETLEANIGTLLTKVQALVTNVGTLQPKVTATETEVRTLKDAVARLDAEREETKKRLAAVEEKVKCLRDCPVKAAPKAKPAAKAAPKPAAKPAPKPEAKAPAAAPKASSCPAGWYVRAYAWSRQQMPEDLRKEVDRHIAAAKTRENWMLPGTDSLSNALGIRLLQELKTPAPVNADITVRFLDGPASSTGKLAHKDAGVLKMVKGTGDFTLPEDPRDHLATEFVWPSEFVSPERSGSPPEPLQPRLMVLAGAVKTCGLLVTGIVP